MNDCVLWQGTGEPPSLLTEYLRGHGLALREMPPDKGAGEGAPWPARRISVLDVLAPPVSGRAALAGRRIALIQPDPGRADSLAQALRARGAEVVALGLAHEAFQRAELLDPDVVLVEPDYFYEECWPLVEAVWRHARLRWATILLMPPEALDSGGLSLPDVRPLCAAIQGLAANVEQLRMLSRGCEHFSIDLDRLGPARTLRVLVDTHRTLRAEFDGPGVSVEIDVAKELVIGARGERDRPNSTVERLFGPNALSACLSLERGNVSVRAVTHPAVANVMAPFDSALYLAQQPAEPEQSEEITKLRMFDDSPTRRWDDDFLAPSTHFDPFELVDVPLSTPPPPPVEDSVVQSHVTTLRPNSGVQRVDSVGARPAVNTVPFRAQSWARRLVPPAMAAGALVGAVVWMSWPRSQPRAHEVHASVTIGEVQPATLASTQRAPLVPAPTHETRPAAAAPDELKPLPSEENEPESEEAPVEQARPRTRGDRGNLLVEEASSLQKRGQYTDARGKYLEALAIVPALPRAQAGLARLALLRDDPAEAVKYALALSKQRPGQAPYQLLLGDAYRAAGKPGLARAAYRVALRLGSPKARARLNE